MAVAGRAQIWRCRKIMRRVAAIKCGTKLAAPPNSTTHQQKEAIKRLKAGESCRSIAKIARLTAGA